MDLINELSELGVNTNEALKRFMNNSSLYIKMLGKLSATINDLEVMKYIEAGDLDKAVENAHTLKGVTGNLSLTPLYDAYTDIVALLREGNSEKAKSILKDILPIQDKIICIIKSSK